MNKPIAVIGSEGKTGKSVIAALSARNYSTRALTRSNIDLESGHGLEENFQNVAAVYALAPNFHPDELGIAARVVLAARNAGVPRLVFHSVLQPQLPQMPHHVAKSEAEEIYINSGIEWAILQPCAYAQNLTAAVVANLPYSPEARFGFVDIADMAQAAVRLLTDPSTTHGIYEACGPETSVAEVGELMGWEVGKQRFKSDGTYAGDCMEAMFEYYELHGLRGSSLTLKMLLEREPSHAVSALKKSLRF